jgi:hypothetical protein
VAGQRAGPDLRRRGDRGGSATCRVEAGERELEGWRGEGCMTT